MAAHGNAVPAGPWLRAVVGVGDPAGRAPAVGAPVAVGDRTAAGRAVGSGRLPSVVDVAEPGVGVADGRPPTLPRGPGVVALLAGMVVEPWVEPERLAEVGRWAADDAAAVGGRCSCCGGFTGPPPADGEPVGARPLWPPLAPGWPPRAGAGLGAAAAAVLGVLVWSFGCLRGSLRSLLFCQSPLKSWSIVSRLDGPVR